MGRKNCSPGQKWDNLVNTCVPRQVKTELPTVPPQQTVVDKVMDTSPASLANPVTLLTPALWLIVVLATVGSILVLILWIIILRRRTRNNNTPDDAELAPEPVQKTEAAAPVHLLLSEGHSQTPVFSQTAPAPSPCAHLHLGQNAGSKIEDGSVKDAGKKQAKQCLPKYSTAREHRIPLPATELGGTALVTTKTM